MAGGTETHAKVNSVERAYEQIRDRVITFRTKPGARLNESELAASLHMSRAPIREALNRLIADGLVSFEAKRGFFCRRLSIAEMTELYAVRRDLELGALKAALESVPAEVLAAFVATWRDVLTGNPVTEHASGQGSGHGAGLPADLDRLVTQDEDFHLALAGMAGNPIRQDFLRNINARIRFVRRINLESDLRRGGALDEHARLLDHLAARDTDAAAALLEKHLNRSADEVRVQVQNAIARIYAEDVA